MNRRRTSTPLSSHRTLRWGLAVVAMSMSVLIVSTPTAVVADAAAAFWAAWAALPAEGAARRRPRVRISRKVVPRVSRRGRWC